MNEIVHKFLDYIIRIIYKPDHGTVEDKRCIDCQQRRKSLHQGPCQEKEGFILVYNSMFGPISSKK